MKAAGIVQQGAPVLTVVAAPFSLPDQAAEASRLIDDLLAAVQRVREHHVFGKGLGLAAPQLGTSKAAAIVLPPGDDAEPVVLLNPRVIDESTESDEQYEGCLSFFDVRGLVPRARRLEVALELWSSARRMNSGQAAAQASLFKPGAGMRACCCR